MPKAVPMSRGCSCTTATFGWFLCVSPGIGEAWPGRLFDADQFVRRDARHAVTPGANDGARTGARRSTRKCKCGLSTTVDSSFDHRLATVGRHTDVPFVPYRRTPRRDELGR